MNDALNMYELYTVHAEHMQQCVPQNVLIHLVSSGWTRELCSLYKWISDQTV